MWDCIKDTTNLNNKERVLSVYNEQERANELNMFYRRFDIVEDRDLPVSIACNANEDRIVIDTSTVVKTFRALEHQEG